MQLAKNSLDVGLFTNAPEEVSAFWCEHAHVQFDHVLPVSRQVRQHRHTLDGAVLKINHAKDPLPPRGTAGYLRLLVACPDAAEPETMTDPDGNELVRWPAGRDGITHWALELATPSVDAFMAFYRDAVGLPVDEAMPCAVACGQSRIVGHVTPDVPDRADNDVMMRPGLRYSTIQVFDVDAEYARIVGHDPAYGAQEPKTLGKTARIAFIRDPFGNWIELSQRASLTGPLPE
ncbi:VOC family protein [Pyruvatibacter mobilis]|uniref:VOC family protein n=1 Tax=Pyruvatibacter mobilis TaxID=1712261 RepID=UPI003BA9A630